MSIIGKTYAGTAKAVNGMKTANRNFKQEGKVADAEKTISDMTREIGRIATAEAEKVRNKVVCPHCGRKTTSGMHYCGWCGQSLSASLPA